MANRIVITNARNYTSTYTVYDGLNRAVLVRDGLGHETHTRYNALGHRTVVTDADGGVTYYGYDGLNRLVSIQYPEFIVQYAYDGVGNRTAMTDTAACQLSPDMCPPIFGQDGPRAEMATGKFQAKKIDDRRFLGYLGCARQSTERRHVHIHI